MMMENYVSDHKIKDYDSS